MILVTMDIAATAASPKPDAATFSSTEATLARPWRPRVGIPADNISLYTHPFMVKNFGWGFSTFPDRITRVSRIRKLTNWLKIVAIAAPEMPILNPNISTGSRMTFSTPPAVIPSMDRAAFPWERRWLLNTKDTVM